MNENETQREVRGWDGYITNFLKANDVDENAWYAVFGIESVKDDEERLRLHVERAPNKYVFDLNKTNTVFLREAGISHPKEVVGRKLKFKKVLVNNPQGKEVESLRICEVDTKEEQVG